MRLPGPWKHPGVNRPPQWVPPAVAGYKWVLHDTDPDIPDYIFAINPNEMESPYVPKTMTMSGMTIDGKYRGFQLDTPHPWQFTGVLHTKAQYENLRERARRGNKALLADHLGRIWEVRLTHFEATRAGNLQHPWRHKYTMHLTTYRNVREVF
jgi:hypothetical protein